MKKFTLPLFSFMMMALLSGCGLMEDAFKAGLFFGILIIAIVGLVIWLLRLVIKQLRKKFEWDLVN